jgi:hypothetical protein
MLTNRRLTKRQRCVVISFLYKLSSSDKKKKIGKNKNKNGAWFKLAPFLLLLELNYRPICSQKITGAKHEKIFDSVNNFSGQLVSSRK